jgi:DNA-binding transcriptional MerR regulator
MYRVREFAALAGVTTRTLRYYDRVGLVTPCRTTAGYRVYTPHQLLRLQQIAALKLLGFSLKQIRQMLHGGILPLREALQAQTAALRERREQLEQSLNAVERAYGAVLAGRNVDGVLSEVMEVFAMSRLDVLKKYFTQDAWDRWRARHTTWPSADWIALYREAQSAVDEDPAGEHAQDLARRCIALAESEANRDPAIRTALRKATMNCQEWSALLQAGMPDVDVERVSRFLANAAWARWDAPDGQSFETPRVRPQASASATAVFHELAAALDVDPGSEHVQKLLRKWKAVIAAQSGGDPQTLRDIQRAASRWRHWPDGMRRWVAYTYGLDALTWERVMTLLESAPAE